MSITIKISTHQNMFVHTAGVTQTIFGQVVEAVHRHPTAGKGKSLHVTAFGSPQSNDVFLGQHIQGHRINPLLVNHNKHVLVTRAHLPFQLNHFLHSGNGYVNYLILQVTKTTFPSFSKKKKKIQNNELNNITKAKNLTNFMNFSGLIHKYSTDVIYLCS